ncbi:Sialic acid TRAP transporter permease protein SiaT [Pirellulimonas nuda]|uniref:Sialic acid TRAP transporter permease protein SiaT n=1 Tax=Pirellulimonas nuda TaxID=2528009 RepID=A0A518DG39_9BACT|nr:Sialic acid TRAP transporter permease protein SiaT [Pirellulimonas nuda]
MDVPISVGLGLSALLTLMSIPGMPASYLVAQKMSTGVASFNLLAIPFFILAGILMGEGGMARRLMDFAAAIVGRTTGGLAYVCTITCMLFGAISGSATAAVSSVGGTILPEMERNGYDRRFSVALTTVSATTGLVIPPSNIMIVYAVVAGNVSVAAMFLAGVLPGVLLGLAIMAVSWLRASTHPPATSSREDATTDGSSWGGQVIYSGLRALPSLALVVIVLAGILVGLFSPTEAAAIAVLYAFLLAVCVYREIRLRDLPNICLRTGITTAVVFLLIAASQATSWALSYENIPQQVGQAMLTLSDNWIVLLLLINVLLLFVGTFMDMTPAVLIFVPIFLPVAAQMGLHPVHFGVLMIVNLCIGLCTPPVGTCLFVGCGVGKTTISELVRPLLPFLAAMIAALMLVTYLPELSLWLPRQAGLLD